MVETLERLAFRPNGSQFAYDNTSLSTYKECPRKYYYSILRGYRAAQESPTLLFGGWFHAAVEEYDHKIAEGKSHQEALRHAVRFALTETTFYAKDFETGEVAISFWAGEKQRTRANLIRSLIWYCEHYIDDPLQTLILKDGRPAIELSFRWEIAPGILYCGHIDKIATYSTHGVYIQERKHTGGTIGSYYFDRYTPDSQISGYTYTAKVIFETPVIGAVVDAIQVAETFSRPMRSIQHRSQEVLDEWAADTVTWINRIQASFDANSWPMNTGACHKFSGCQFRKVCSRAPGIRSMILESEFVIRGWDPLSVRGKGVEEAT